MAHFRFDNDNAADAEHSKRVNQLARRIKSLNMFQLDAVERVIASLEANLVAAVAKSMDPNNAAFSFDWPHAPIHRLSGKGTYIVTAGTYQKSHFFHDPARLDYLMQEFLTKADDYRWQPEAWAMFPNHYHFVANALEEAGSLKPFLSHLHADTAREINRRDGTKGRQVWFNFWDTELTYEKSYLARLNYVHQNAVKHGIVPVANQYRWCSAAWFERTAPRSQVKMIYGFKTDKVNVFDEFGSFGVR